MIRDYRPAIALKIIRHHDLCTTMIADAFLSMRELHQAFNIDLTVADSIRDVAWDIIRDGYKMPIEDAIQVVRHSIINLEIK